VGRFRTIAVAAGCALLAVAGCSRSEFIEITGKVAWNGQPIDVGEIVFAPTNKSVAPTAGRIRGGAYKLLTKPGKMRVEIQAVRKTGKRDPREGFEITELYIPRRYNDASELVAEVTPEGDHVFNFMLTD
jgi:hypothetical protein